jgi:predicted phosphodiesterase
MIVLQMNGHLSSGRSVAVISDIHGNLAALAAVAEDIAQWGPDRVVVAGDIVSRGPYSRECLAYIRARMADSGWLAIYGNHEEYVLSVARSDVPRAGLEEEVRRNIVWTWRQIGDVAPLAELPEVVRLAGPDGGEVRVVHASMRGNRDNILPRTPDSTLREQIAPAPAVFAMGHTHVPLVRRIDDTLVVNAGAVGMPFDGDVRASYARLTWSGVQWHAEIVRLEYDREQTARGFRESGFLESSVIGDLIFDEFMTARPRLANWITRYQPLVLAGEITPAESVRAFLAEQQR